VKPLTPSKAVDLVYVAADAVMEAYTALNRIPFNQRPALDALFDGKVYPGDLDTLAKTLNALADEWQDEIEAAESAAEEADDRRRDNPLEPDFRRLGQ